MAEHNVTLPQMGEAVHEGTVTRWHKKVGDRVQANEVLFEVSTDKVDTEIPSPFSGILAKIMVPERAVAKVGGPVAIVCDEIEEVDRLTAPRTATAEPLFAPKSEVLAAPAGREVALAPAGKPLSSPLVRRMAAAHDIDLATVQGTGLNGRITKNDILPILEGRPPAPPPEPPSREMLPPPAPLAPATPTPAWTGGVAPEIATLFNPAAIPPGMQVERVPMSPMRKRIADHMVHSKRTSAHVTSVVEVDLQRIVELREKNKAAFEKRYGHKLSFTPFFLSAAVAALKAVPVVNASVDGEEIIYKKNIHLAVAVALDWGLIVPVIRNAGDLNFAGLSREMHRLAEAARTKKLMPDEVKDGTFSISNFGTFGTLLGHPIINQPQVGILGIGAMVKRPVVINDAIAIRTMAYVVLSFDHRIIDGLESGRFLSIVKERLENWNEPIL